MTTVIIIVVPPGLFGVLYYSHLDAGIITLQNSAINHQCVNHQHNRAMKGSTPLQSISSMIQTKHHHQLIQPQVWTVATYCMSDVYILPHCSLILPCVSVVSWSTGHGNNGSVMAPALYANFPKQSHKLCLSLVSMIMSSTGKQQTTSQLD